MAGIFIIMLVASGFGHLIENPPKDLASLVDPQTVLTQMKVKTDEDALLAHLTPKTKKVAAISPAAAEKAIKELGAENFKTRRNAKTQLEQAGADATPYLIKALSNNDPEVKISVQKLLDTINAAKEADADAATKQYVTKLMAIRLLATMKSAKAVPVLKIVSADSDPTLADAATNALNVIQGKPEVRPEAKGLILDVMTRIPQDASFVIALDMATGAKTLRALDFVKKMIKEPAMQGMMPPNAMGDIEKEVPKGILTALGMLGNVRVDTAFQMFSGSFGANKGSCYMGFIFKGLYDPKRMESMIMELGGVKMKRIEMHGKRVLHDSGDSAFCCIDKNTFLMAIDPWKTAGGLHIEPLVAAFVKDVKPQTLEQLTTRIPKLIPAVKDMLDGNARLGAAGSLSDVQKSEARDNMLPELARTTERLKKNASPETKFQKTAMEMVVEVIEADKYFGTIAAKTGLTIGVISPTVEKATKLETSFNAFDKGLRDMILMAKARMQGQEIPAFAKKMLEVIQTDKPLFPIKRTDKKTEVKVDLKQLMLFQLLTFGARMG